MANVCGVVHGNANGHNQINHCEHIQLESPLSHHPDNAHIHHAENDDHDDDGRDARHQYQRSLSRRSEM